MVRADAAYYNAETIGWCQKHEADFVIMHKPRRGRVGPPAGIRDEDLELVETNDDGTAWVSVRTTSTLRGRVKPFSVVHYLKVGPGIQSEMLYGHYAIATSMDGIGALELRELYNRRGDDCENRIKDYGSDLAGKRMSSSKLGPNRVLAHMKAIAHNLFMLLRRLLFGGWRPRLKQFRLWVQQIPCSLVRSNRKTLLRIHNNARFRQLVKWSRKLGDAFAP